MKKVLLITLSIIFIALLGWAVWYFVINDTPSTEGNPFSNVLPFGTGDNIDFPSPFGEGGDSLGTPGVESGKPTEALFRITNAPVAGFAVLGAGSSTTVRYTDRATGHIYDTALDNVDLEKISNTTLPKVYEAIYSSDGRRVIYRSLDDSGFVKNLSILLTPPNATSTSNLYTQSSTVLNSNIQEVVAGGGGQMYYISDSLNALVTSNFDGSGAQVILNTPFKAWRISLENGVILWTKASSNTPGYAYRLNNNSLTRLLGPLNGLSVVVGDSGELAFSYKEAGEVRLFAQNSQSDLSYEVLPSTIAEKCVWNPVEQNTLYCGIPVGGVGVDEPDNWYKGVSHYSDRIWQFDTSVDIADILAEPKKKFDIDIDVSDLKMSSDGGYLVFINRNDLSLWALKLE